jgi:DNA (cytosine-5)-methyltransferase 1
MNHGTGVRSVIQSRDGHTAIGMFAGIGGIELGLHEAGFETRMLCEIMPEALRVLKDKREFRGARFETDVRDLAAIKDPKELDERFPEVDIIAAGFPCQDLSQAGGTAGIGGQNSGLVTSLLKLLSMRPDSPKWVLLENVPFMLRLDQGKAMAFLTERLGKLGFRWAYRVIDARSFGIPQRRQRVVLLASRIEDPRPVLFADDAPGPDRAKRPRTPCGFYWTEGNTGLGWAIDAVPTLKGGSTVGIPSPPAIWFPARDFFGTPDIRDAERLQGFPSDWTLAAVDNAKQRNGPRWKLVGNAVCVSMSRWVGQRIIEPGDFNPEIASQEWPGSWPRAAYGEPTGKFWSINVGDFPVAEPYQALGGFLNHRPRPLSERAARGFYGRFERSTLKKPDGFLNSLRQYLEQIEVSNETTVPN